ncbi:right-handed parallel beta-helix repeat-containing protein [Natronomonas salina]|uniref:right-handed parallel beta-helix repeat-containing protein n=1 Tax=Natronomonas salina TaxID=1710540 RepID=UPI0015B4F993|nr:right-handed parallel beta-helix repeat-containing protein [Natronomonas salina]QLD90314.1 right-handed parallel beta-helix repeat-containing protein [Natronomonas salina]
MIAAAVLTVASMLLAGGIAGVASADSHRTVDSCTTINESGTYTLASDVETSETGACFDVQAYPVTIDGDGHTISGPGSDTDSSGVSLAGGSSDDFTLQDATVDGFGTGVDATYGPSGQIVLQSVTATGNDVGVDADYVAADIQISESRVDGNAEVGFTAASSGPITVDATTFNDNGATGFHTTESSGVTMTAVELSGNDGSGMVVGGRGDTYTIEDTTVTDNSKHGIKAFSNAVHLDISGSTLAGNGESDLNSDIRTSLADVQVGDATVDVEDEEEFDATGVPQSDLNSDSDDRTFDDGVALSRLDGSAEVTLPSGSHDSVDVLRHADGWTTYESALQPTDGAVSVTVQDDGTYALGERADEATPEETATATPTSTPEATATQTPEPSTTAGADGGLSASSSDTTTETATPDETDRDTSGGSDGVSSSSADETPTGTEEQSTPVTVTVTGSDDSTTSSSETDQEDTESADESGESTDTATEESVSSPEEASGDGPGLGGLAALLALAATALLLSTRRRRE